MPENEDLEVPGSVVSATPSTADEETGEGAEDEVEKRQHRPIVAGLFDRESEFPTPTGIDAVRVSPDPPILNRLSLPRGRTGALPS
jgi:hypothetical protein